MVGGTGFVGGHLAEYFFKEGEISKGIFRRGSYLRVMDQCGVQCLEADLMDRHSLHEPLDMVDVVYNLAFPPATGSPGDYSKFNTTALNNLLEEANEHGTKVFVHLSCLDVYGSAGALSGEVSPRPGAGYQRAKLDAEEVLTRFGREHPDMKVRVLRAASAVGARDKTITLPLLKMVEAGKVVLPAGAAGIMSLSHPKDVAQALLRAATYTGEWELCLIKSFNASIEGYSRMLSAATGRKAEVKSGGLLSGRSPIPQYAADQIRAGRTIEEQAFWKKLSYVPGFSLEKTAEEVAEWHRREPWITKGPA